MTRSLLNRLPDIMGKAALRSAEALHALGLAPGLDRAGRPSAPFSPARQTPASQDKAPRRQLWVQRDLPALLTLLTGTNTQPSLWHRVGFLWLSSGSGDPAREQVTPSPEHVLPEGQALLSDLALRLFVARELFSPCATVAVTPHPGLASCTRLLMQAVLGSPAHWSRMDERPSAQTLLTCTRSTQGTPQTRRPGPATVWSLSQYLKRTATPELAALVLSPGRGAAHLLWNWPGDWVITHPDRHALALLRQQLARQLAHQPASPATLWPVGKVQASPPPWGGVATG